MPDIPGLGLEVIIRCSWCWESTTVYGPSTWPTVPKGWTVDRASFYFSQARHFCPRHTSGVRTSY